MPKDQHPLHGGAATQRKPSTVDPTLRRGQACLTCRKRKTRCDAVQPTCGACNRSHRHALQHLKAGEMPPQLPVCEYEDDSATSARPARSSQPGVEKLEDRISELEDLLRLSVGGEALEALKGARQGPTMTRPTTHNQPSAPIPHPESTTTGAGQPQQQYAGTLPSPPGTNPSYSSASGHSSTSTTFVSPPFFSASAPSSSSSPVTSGSRKDSTTSSASHGIFLSDPDPASMAALSGLPSMSESPLDMSGLSPDMLGRGPALDPKTEEFMMQVLWPGWPPHLPPPAYLEHVVHTFFACVPWGRVMFNEARFLNRLALPPTNSNFPHPAILHAICAATARHLAIEMTDTWEQAHNQRVDRPVASSFLGPERVRPRWSGIGPRPANIELIPGLDNDFADIHFSWAKLYINNNESYVPDWWPILQAIVIVAMYCHTCAMWIEGWGMIGQAARLAVPLGLFLKKATQPRRGIKDALLPPPADLIEQMERQNLAWLILSMDTQASISSGWSSGLDDRDFNMVIPLGVASSPPSQLPPDEAMQCATSHDVFRNHPPYHQNTFAFYIKSLLLARRSSAFIRRAGMDADPNVDPRTRPGFAALDHLLTAFQAMLPSVLKIIGQDDRGRQIVDQELLCAHSVLQTSILSMHDAYCDYSNPQDPSKGRLLTASRDMLCLVHILNSTTFDMGRIWPFFCFSLFIGARTLQKFLQLALDTNDVYSQNSLQGEIDTFRNTLLKVAARTSLGAKQIMMLDLYKPTQPAPTAQDSDCFQRTVFDKLDYQKYIVEKLSKTVDSNQPSVKADPLPRPLYPFGPVRGFPHPNAASYSGLGEAPTASASLFPLSSPSGSPPSATSAGAIITSASASPPEDSKTTQAAQASVLGVTNDVDAAAVADEWMRDFFAMSAPTTSQGNGAGGGEEVGEAGFCTLNGGGGQQMMGMDCSPD